MSNSSATLICNINLAEQSFPSFWNEAEADALFCLFLSMLMEKLRYRWINGS